MGIRFLAPAAVTGLLLSAVVAPQRAAAQEAVVGADSSFIQMAGSLGLLQAKLGKAAQERGSSPAVKDFGRRMVADYAKANEEIAAAAKQAAFPAPVMLRQHKQLYDRISRMGGSSFDKHYMAEMVKDHDEAVRLFKQEAEGGRVASLKQLAVKLLPDVQQHQALAAQTAGSVGADVTATTSGVRRGS